MPLQQGRGYPALDDMVFFFFPLSLSSGTLAFTSIGLNFLLFFRWPLLVPLAQVLLMQMFLQLIHSSITLLAVGGWRFAVVHSYSVSHSSLSLSLFALLVFFFFFFLLSL